MPAKKKPLTYPDHPEFEELLNSCGSMTRQLEALGHNLTVKLLAEEVVDDYFCRYTLLCLKQTGVVLACSRSQLCHQYFCQLLVNANTTPIGKFLFAAGSTVSRANDMVVNLLPLPTIRPEKLQDYLTTANYSPEQIFWCRHSHFNYQHEQFELTEIILPELDAFF